MRSPREIKFRITQEVSNLGMFLAKPELPGSGDYIPLVELPSPSQLAAAASPALKSQIVRIADKVLDGRFPILGGEIEAGANIDWRRDYVSTRTSELQYFRLVPYLEFEKVGDHKVIWELSRHQHLVTLAQAWLLTGESRYLAKLFQLLESWLDQNPFPKGINWTSALEVAFRALSWVWIYHLAGQQMNESLREKFYVELYRHGRFLNSNLSTYFSANTHLLGEAVALHTLGTLFPMFPEGGEWRRSAGELLERLILDQIREDGGYFEQSSYYHVYALDMYLFHSLLATVSEAYKKRLSKAADFLAALLGPSGELSFFGDDDGGRFFHPYGYKECYGRATLATAAAILDRRDLPFDPDDFHEHALWWIGPRVLEHRSTAQPATGTRWFPDTGIAVMSRDALQLVFKTGGMGSLAGHSHADLLSFTLRDGDEKLFIDPGTFTYVGDLMWRQWFRGTAAHNTLRIGGRDQGLPRGPFHWAERPEARPGKFDNYQTTGECSYGGFTHKRTVRLKARFVIVVDEVSGPPGEHRIEQFWHFGVPARILRPDCFQIGSRARLHAAPGTSRELEEGREYGWYSPAFGVKESSFALHVEVMAKLPTTLVTVIDLDGAHDSLPATVLENGA